MTIFRSGSVIASRSREVYATGMERMAMKGMPHDVRPGRQRRNENRDDQQVDGARDEAQSGASQQEEAVS